MATEKTRSLRVALIAGLAGGATLAGEVLGARLLRPVVGSTAASHGGTVAGVLGGLGLGAWLAGRWLERGRLAPRRCLEASLASLAALSLAAPWLAAAATVPCARALVALAERSPGAADALRALLAVAFTVPAGVATGASYPALAALHGRGAGRATAVSGAASSLGAAAAVLVVTFLLAPSVGVRASLWASAALYAVALGLAQTFARDDTGGRDSPAQPPPAQTSPPFRGRGRRARRAPPAQTSPPLAPLAPPAPPRTVLWVLGGVGAASIIWQLVMSRLGALAFGPSAFALAAATAAHTASLATGEAVAATRVDRLRAPRHALVGLLALAAALGTVATALAGRLPAWSAALYPGAGPSMTRVWAGALGLLVLLTLPVVALIGATIPLGARLLADAGAPRASANGNVLWAMSAGNALGALAGPLVLVPALSLRGALLAALALLAAGAALAAGRAALARPGGALKVALAAALLVAGGARAARAWDPATLSAGPFLYAGSEGVELGRIVASRDGREATVVVRRDEAGTALLQIDGKVDATTAGDAATQILVGVVPAVLCARPRDVLVVGLGSGMTVDAVRDVPGVGRVDVTELLPEVIDAARTHFRAANHAVLDSPRVRVLRQDASLYLRGARARYDVVVSQPSNPWVAGMADLFTVEALEAARARLNPGGVMAAWFHAHSTDAATFASVVATFARVFPRAALLELSAGQDYMVVGMVPPVRVDVDRAAAALASPSLRPHLERADVAERGAFFGRFAAGADGVRAVSRDGEVLSADDLRLEFRAPLLLYNDASQDIFALLARAQDLPLAGLGPAGGAYAAVIDESEPVREAALHGRQMALATAARDLEGAIHEGEQAVAAAPGDAALRTALARQYVRRAARRYRSRQDPGGAEEDLRTALELRPAAAVRFRAHLVLGDMALTRRDYRRAASDYGAALEIARLTAAPAPELHVRMSQVLWALGDRAHARAELDRALRECADPDRLRELEALRATLGD